MQIEELLTFCVKKQASDLHLSVGEAPILRIHGEIWRSAFPILSAQMVRDLLLDTMNPAQASAFQSLLEVDYAFELPNVARFRVNAFHTNRGVAAVFRVIPNRVPSLDDLHAPAVFKQIVDAPRGLVLVTGPTGSGKSTTLAAMLQHINQTRPHHILTIEDPIEFVHHNQRALINQRELNRHTHHVHTALRSALREDPNVILVGEMRDTETIKLALTAAETGHLVLATLHTTGAAKTANRIIDVFPAGEKDAVRMMLAESLRAVVSQVLLKHSNQNERVAAHEILLATPAVRNLIRENKIAQLQSVMQTSHAQGMQTLDMALNKLVSQGKILPETAQTYLQTH
ncbi:MAG: type IV pilus twitching motility protein PilT [Neisseria sp.]|nr:type IV pilus twitching motility protein PilT [Neisseria sp.]